MPDPEPPATPDPAGDVARDDALRTTRQLVDGVLGPLKQTFVGKDIAIDLLGVGLIARENVFLFGPPGTAKSALVNELAHRIDGRVFDYLLTRFTEPNEVFGPFDIRQLREGELVTNTEGMLPEADLVFLDELLNANSAILNALLLALNERVFRRGRETRDLPTLMVVAAGNSLPEDEALAALFDRFLIRTLVDNVPGDDLSRVLEAGWALEQQRSGSGGNEAETQRVSVDDLRVAQHAVARVDVSSVRDVFGELLLAIRRAGLSVSDRRAVRYQRLLAASAMLCGRMTAQASDLWTLRYTWDRIEQRSVLTTLVDEAIERGTQPDDTAAHPQATAASAPDPESLARDLDTLASEIAAASGGQQLALRDRVAAIAGRVQWIGAGEQRTALDAQLDRLWKSLA